MTKTLSGFGVRYVDDAEAAALSRTPNGDTRAFASRSVFARTADHVLNLGFSDAMPMSVRLAGLGINVKSRLHVAFTSTSARSSILDTAVREV